MDHLRICFLLTLFRYIEDEDQLAHLPNSQYQAIVTTVDEVRIWKCFANIDVCCVDYVYFFFFHS